MRRAPFALPPFAAPLSGLGLLVLALAAHVAIGVQSASPAQIWQALTTATATSQTDLVIRDLRLPRALAAALVGAGLSAAGVVMQAMTRNPLAEPGTFGLLAGGATAVVLGIGWLGLAGPDLAPLFAALGAAGAGGMVWLVALAAPPSGRIAALVLAGAAISAFLTAIDSAILLLDEQALRSLRVWLVGSLTGLRWQALVWSAPWALAGVALALVLAPALSVLALGDDAARGLGIAPQRLRITAMVAVLLCTASAVALAGMMAFVGLVVPHAVRLLVGAEYRRLLPWSVLAGAIYLPLVDLAARMMLAPQEVATGLVSALIGAPLFLWLVKVRT